MADQPRLRPYRSWRRGPVSLASIRFQFLLKPPRRCRLDSPYANFTPDRVRRRIGERRAPATAVCRRSAVRKSAANVRHRVPPRGREVSPAPRCRTTQSARSTSLRGGDRARRFPFSRRPPVRRCHAAHSGFFVSSVYARWVAGPRISTEGDPRSGCAFLGRSTRGRAGVLRTAARSPPARSASDTGLLLAHISLPTSHGTAGGASRQSLTGTARIDSRPCHVCSLRASRRLPRRAMCYGSTTA